MSSERPITSKPRGICRYYNTPRGCYAGKKCKFLHGETEKLTPYDQNKTCKYFAAGYCLRGAQCWFKHVAADAPRSDKEAVLPAGPPEDEDHLCCICYEKPVTYGLLEGCGHMFCVQCIREWRDPNGKSEDMISSGNTKKCPFCRASSKFVTPSSHFYLEGDPRKATTIEKYKASMARVPCRLFQESPPSNRFCPFGKDCFYQHLNEDGTPYVFDGGVDHYMRIYQRRLHRDRYSSSGIPTDYLGYTSNPFDDLSATIEAIAANLPELNNETGLYSDTVSESESDFVDHEHDGTGHSANIQDSLDRLMDFLANARLDDPPESVRPRYRFGTATPLATDESSGTIGSVNRITVSDLVTHLQADPNPPVHEPVVPIFGDMTPDSQRPSSSMSGRNQSDHDSSADSMPQITRANSVPEAGPRFSTVVHRGGRFIADHTLGDVDEVRQLPETASGLSRSVQCLTLAETPESEPIQGRSLEDDHVAEETAALLSDSEDFDRRVQEVLDLETLDPSGASTSGPTDETVPEEVRSAPHELEALQDADPPFLTDGRGRVVWSSTTPGRHRESRRGRTVTSSSSASTQLKAGRDASDGVVRAGEDRVSGGTDRHGSCPRLPSRPQTTPESSEDHGVTERSGAFVTDGRGRVISAGMSPATAAAGVEGGERQVGQALDLNSEAEGSASLLSETQDERSFIGRIFDAVFVL
ncbi:hypothetical protein AcV5_009245 [Taiwanofungus camphoratus]|nr:hypothetical protein AcV5_009245 [Antrodia cinnamomea]